MKLPRNVGGDELARYLTRIGYERVHQTGSHVRIRAIIDGRPHTITIPLNDPLPCRNIASYPKTMWRRIFTFHGPG